MTISKITARPGAKIMQNADKFFDNSPRTIVDEIVQNARRASATTITFKLIGSDLIIKDNGAGLPAEKADVLLQFGGSANAESVELRENAAGIGFFCLAKNDVKVRSHDWCMLISQKSFRQQDDAVLESGLKFLAGFEITVRNLIASKERASEWRTQILSRTIYSGITTILENFPNQNGDVTKRQIQKPNNFLDAHSGLHAIQGTLPGLKIKLVRRTPTYKESDDKTHRIVFNFHGQLITETQTMPTELVPTFPWRETYTTISNQDKRPSFDPHSIVNAVYVDVDDTSLLQLKLPDRSSIIATPRLAELRAEIDRLYVALLQRPSVPNGLDLKNPLRHGNPLPCPNKRVEAIAAHGPVAGYSLRGNYSGNDDLLIVPHSDDPTKPKLIDINGAEIDPSSILATCENKYLFGYLDDQIARKIDNKKAGLWFYNEKHLTPAFGDQIPTLDAVSLLIKVDDEEFETAPFESNEFGFYELNEIVEETENLSDFTDNPVDEIHLRLHIKAKTHSFPLECLAYDGGDGEGYPEFFAKKSAGQGTITSILMNTLDWYREDDGDSYDTQEHQQQKEYERQVAEKFGETETLLLENIEAMIRDQLRCHNPPKAEEPISRYVITIDRSEGRWKEKISVEKTNA